MICVLCIYIYIYSIHFYIRLDQSLQSKEAFAKVGWCLNYVTTRSNQHILFIWYGVSPWLPLYFSMILMDTAAKGKPWEKKTWVQGQQSDTGWNWDNKVTTKFHKEVDFQPFWVRVQVEPLLQGFWQVTFWTPNRYPEKPATHAPGNPPSNSTSSNGLTCCLNLLNMDVSCPRNLGYSNPIYVIAAADWREQFSQLVFFQAGYAVLLAQLTLNSKHLSGLETLRKNLVKSLFYVFWWTLST